MDYKKLAAAIKKDIEESIKSIDIDIDKIITDFVKNSSGDDASKLCQQMYEAGKKDGYAQAKTEMKGV